MHLAHRPYFMSYVVFHFDQANTIQVQRRLNHFPRSRCKATGNVPGNATALIINATKKKNKVVITFMDIFFIANVVINRSLSFKSLTFPRNSSLSECIKTVYISIVFFCCCCVFVVACRCRYAGIWAFKLLLLFIR